MKKDNQQLTINNQIRGGYIALTSILVISAVALAISTSISLLGIGEAQSSLDYRKGQEVLKFAEGCTEEALLRLRNDDTYVGSALNEGDSSCTIIVSGAGTSRVVDVEAQTTGPSATYMKKIRTTIVRTGNSVNLIDWTEIE